MSVPVSDSLFILLAGMPSHLTVIKISDWGGLAELACCLKAKGGHKGRLQQPLPGRLRCNYKPPSCAD